jgi:hypothetical protein
VLISAKCRFIASVLTCGRISAVTERITVSGSLIRHLNPVLQEAVNCDADRGSKLYRRAGSDRASHMRPNLGVIRKRPVSPPA